MKPNGRIALAFTSYSRQSKKGLMETFAIADFNRARIVDGDHGLSLLGSKPDFLKPRWRMSRDSQNQRWRGRQLMRPIDAEEQIVVD
jgi:hypothetical protein